MPSVPLEALEPDDPRELGGYRLLGRLGAGGMGIAYLSEGPSGWAVVKTLWPQLRSDASVRSRLARELDAMRAASGPRVAAVLDQDLAGPSPWFAMQFVPGVTLARQVSESGPLRAAEVRALAAGLADALATTAAAGVVHRDLKPANIMMSPDGPVLLDFGIADLADATALTRTGLVVGSAGWMTPEQVTGEEATPATDVHAWGLCVLYAATGSPAFTGPNTSAMIYQVLHSSPEVPASLGEPLAGLVAAAVSKEPTSRPTAATLTARLRLPRAESPTRADLTPATAVTPVPPTPGRSGGNVRAMAIGAVAALLVVSLLGVGFALGRGADSGTAAEASMTPTQRSSTTTATPSPRKATASPAPLASRTKAASPKPGPTVTVTTTATAPAPREPSGDDLFALDPDSAEFAAAADRILCSGQYLPEIGRSERAYWPVLLAQRELNAIYPTSPTDPNNITLNGVFGPITERLTQWFQYDSYATVTGRVGPETWQRFRNIRCNGEQPPPPRVGD